MTYRERLSVPLAYWIIAFAFGLSFVTAIGFYLGPWEAVVSGVLTAAGISAVLLRLGGVRITVDAAGLTVGRSLLEWPYVGNVTIHDAAAARRRLGVDAVASAWVVQRPYIPGAVEVEVEDAADPHPYWLVSSRNPAQMAAAIEKNRRAAVDQ